MLLLLSTLHAATPAGIQAYTEARWTRSAFVVAEAGVVLTAAPDPARSPVPWGVFDGVGRLLTADQFALEAGDAGMLKRFDKEKKDKTVGNVVATVVAIVAVSAGSSASGAPAYPTPDASAGPQQSPTWSWIVSQRVVSDYYTGPVADELIRRHNSALRRQHGLSPEEAEAIDRTAPGAAAAAAAP